MNYGELRTKLEEFSDRLIEHRELWGCSLESSIPDKPVRNGVALERQQRELARYLAVLNPYLSMLSPGRIKVHRMSGNHWDIFQEAVGMNTAIIKGDSINDSILQLEGMIAVAETKDPDAVVEIDRRSDSLAERDARRASKGGHSIEIKGGNVNIGDHGTINVGISVADLLSAAVGEIAKSSTEPEQVRTLRGRLRAILEHPLGRLLGQIAVREVLKHG